MAIAVFLDEDRSLGIPLVQSLSAFRAWAMSGDFPEQGRIDYIDGRIEVDRSPEELYCHGAIMDTERLPPAYWRAGVSEFWLIDARGNDLVFQVHDRNHGRFQPVAPDAMGFQLSGVFGCRFHLARRRNGRGRWRFELPQS